MKSYYFTPFDKVRALSQLAPQEKNPIPFFKENPYQGPMEVMKGLMREGGSMALLRSSGFTIFTTFLANMPRTLVVL